MEESPFRQNQDPSALRVDPRPSLWQRIKKTLAPIGVLIVALFAKLKFLLLAALKFFPLILKTGGTMVLSVWAYALAWGWWFALGFVVLIFVHECGHLVVARRFGLKVGAPVFIPFMGAFIALKEAPRDAWMEACVGIGGPFFGALGSAACFALYPLTGNALFIALGYTGCFLNLFNLAPLGFLDGGRIVTALSPWLWLVGLALIGGWAFLHPNFLVILVLVMSLPRLFSLFRARTDEEKRYFEVTPGRRVTMAVFYFGLAAALIFGMYAAHAAIQAGPGQTQ
ncbi:MAG TPA: site-2 protease family protein [Opitutaceae bacterium]|nr:site-2 protease family protein [Opitutaceae bacterium]